MERTILNLNIPYFLAALHRDRDSSLANRPLAVAEPGQRGRVISPSREALSEGIRPGMFAFRAKKSCRSLVLIPPDPGLYHKAQDVILQRLLSFTPLVETATWGSFFLDLSGTRLFLGNSMDAAVKVRDEVKSAAGFPSRLGLAVNKLVSRVAGTLTRPLEVLSVYPGQEAMFLAPLPVGRLPRLGPATAAVLEGELGVNTCGQLAGLDPRLLTSVFGRRGVEVCRIARGEDHCPVEPPKKSAALTFSHEFPGGENNMDLLLARLFLFSEELGRELRVRNRVPGSLMVKIFYADGAAKTAQAKADGSQNNLDTNIFGKASLLLARVLTRRIRVRRLTLSAFALRMPLAQLSLFPQDCGRTRALNEAIDRIRARFGVNAVFFGRKGIL